MSEQPSAEIDAGYIGPLEDGDPRCPTCGNDPNDPSLHAEGCSLIETDPRTHGLNHAPLPLGKWLAPGFCSGCDEERARLSSSDDARPLPPGQP